MFHFHGNIANFSVYYYKNDLTINLKGYQNCNANMDLENKWYHSCGCCDDSQSCEQLKKQVTDKYFEKKS